MLALLLVVVGGGEAPVQVKEPARVGQIVILGNEVTPPGLIVDRLQLYPGQVLTSPELRAVQQRLRWLTLLGIDSSVSVIEDGSGFTDITVTVNEAPLTCLLVGVPKALLGRLYGR
jgi:outer membrane protein assembly factor BamA